MRLRLACGPVSWGVDFAGDPANPPWPEVLDGIARAGYRWSELGPLGYLPEEPAELVAELSDRNLRVAGSFVFQPLHDGSLLREVAAVTIRTSQLIAGVGGRHLVVIDSVTGERGPTAGRSNDAVRLQRERWLTLLDGIRMVAGIARDHGLYPVLHPHAGTYLEFEDEIEGLLEELDPDEVGLCIDTGHSAYAGINPVDLYLRHANRVVYLHLKDVDPAVHRRVIEERAGFWDAVTRGVFCPLGSGVVEFESLAAALEENGFNGWATVEQDRDPASDGDPADDAIKSRVFLERVGLAERE